MHSDGRLQWMEVLYDTVQCTGFHLCVHRRTLLPRHHSQLFLFHLLYLSKEANRILGPVSHLRHHRLALSHQARRVEPKTLEDPGEQRVAKAEADDREERGPSRKTPS